MAAEDGLLLVSREWCGADLTSTEWSTEGLYSVVGSWWCSASQCWRRYEPTPFDADWSGLAAAAKVRLSLRT